MVDIARDHDTVVPTNSRPAAGPRTLTVQAPPRQLVDTTTHSGSNGGSPIATRTQEPRTSAATRYVLAGIRLALGWVFLWAFLDKLFGLGHDTVAAKSWLNGGSPTKGFLGSAATGPFTGFYHSIAGTGFADWGFMLALLAIGTALILGVGMRLAAGAGAVLTVMMWSAVLPPANNPFMDDHLIYAGVLIALALLGAGTTLGLGRMWAATPLVRRFTWLT